MQNCFDNNADEVTLSQPYRFPILRYPYEVDLTENPEIQNEQIYDINANVSNEFQFGITDNRFDAASPFVDKELSPESPFIQKISNENVNQSNTKLMEANTKEKEKRAKLEDKISEIRLRKHKAESELDEIQHAKKQRKV